MNALIRFGTAIWDLICSRVATLCDRVLLVSTSKQKHYASLRKSLNAWYLGPPDARRSAPRSEEPDDGELSVVVISLNAQRELVDAVRSLCEQDPIPEIIIVNSGEPGAEQLLQDAGLRATIIESPVRLSPGAARNVGIAAAHGSFVGFLAADCIALPGWVSGRLKSHHQGADLVSSSVVNAHPWNPFAGAAHVLLFASRLPGTPVRHRQHYGASYRMTLFAKYGYFSAHLRSGEDTEFNRRLARSVTRVFDPRVRAAHRNPRSLLALLRDQYNRGRRRALASEAIGIPINQAEIAKMGIARSHKLNRLARQATPGKEWPRLFWSLPWTYPASLAYAIGVRRAPIKKALSKIQISSSRSSRLRLVALLQFRNDHHFLHDYLINVGAQVDGILILDDGSEPDIPSELARNCKVLEVIRVAPRAPHIWDERRNQRLLLDCARRHEAEWLLAIDTDERLESEFRRRADPYLDDGDRNGIFAYSLILRELWDTPYQFRVDGIWGRKRRPRLFKTRLDHEQSTTPIHACWAPLNAKGEQGGFSNADLIVYHLAMISREQRHARLVKYKALDPNNASQAIGYDYLIDETGLELSPLPKGREY